MKVDVDCLACGKTYFLGTDHTCDTGTRPCPECDTGVTMCECGVWDCGFYNHLQFECPSEAGKAYRDKIERRKQRRKMKSIKPLGDRVIIQPKDSKDRTASGLFIPEIAKDTPVTGIVMAVGQGRYTAQGELIPLDVECNDSVVYRQGAGDKFEHNGQKLLIMREEDIIAVRVD